LGVLGIAKKIRATRRGRKEDEGDTAMARKLPPAVYERAVELYLSGKSAKAVAEELGISALTVYKAVREAGLTPRPRGAHLKQLRSKLTDGDKEYIIHRYNQGDSSTMIAKALGVSSVTVIRVLRQAGVPIRNRGTKRQQPLLFEGASEQGLAGQAEEGVTIAAEDVIKAELDNGNGNSAS
jgi:transposase-like protein